MSAQTAQATVTRRRRGRPRTYTERAEMAQVRARPVVAQMNSKPRYSLQEAAYLLGLSVPTLYVRMRDGLLHTVTDGRRTFLTNDEIARYAALSNR
jgi:hypothetical protein